MKIILRSLFASLVIGFLAAGANDCNGQRLQITGGIVRLELGAPLAPGLDPQPDSNDKSRLMWFFPPVRSTKIVVSSVAPGQKYLLFVRAMDVDGGTGQPELRLTDGMAPRDFIRDIERLRNVGRARLSYRVEAPASSGAGADTHTVTYTWLEQ